MTPTELAKNYAKHNKKLLLGFFGDDYNSTPHYFCFTDLGNIKTIEDLCNQIKIAHLECYGSCETKSINNVECDDVNDCVCVYFCKSTMAIEIEIDQSILQTNGKEEEFKKYLDLN